MTPDRTDEKRMANYRQSLISALLPKNMPGDRIGQIVAEVESHVAETGEDPAEAFGSPRDYAADLTTERRSEPWWHTALITVLAGIAGAFVALGGLSVLLGVDYLNQPGWLWLTMGLFIGVPAGVWVYRRSTRVRDPRTGADMLPMARWGLAVLIVPTLAIVLIAWIAIKLVETLT
ncbi:HAAS signaling domain-containing protein [Janibacter cremeus]|uniref:Uncharacterized protein n=1 Tax=Janibacter cremeus TaxID=1285192 RepID=A0A852VW93_9MICO|nr:hypothetical protein [Janibacter cremeus]NYF98534.1 hypothetical protein [Janibacter cremeus]